MALYVFVSGKNPKQFAVAADPSAPRLPLAHGPWTFKRFEPIRDRVGYIDREKAEAGIEAHSFHLCRDLTL